MIGTWCEVGYVKVDTACESVKDSVIGTWYELVNFKVDTACESVTDSTEVWDGKWCESVRNCKVNDVYKWTGR